jgi:hypothetical protein
MTDRSCFLSSFFLRRESTETVCVKRSLFQSWPILRLISAHSLEMPEAEYQPSAEELTQAIKDTKAAHPDFGIKRIWTYLKEEKQWLVSEKRVKQVDSASEAA